MKNYFSKLPIVACALLIASTPTLLHAQTTAYTATGTETDLASYGISGVEFQLNMNIDVTSLGFTGLSINGADTPQVTVWQIGSGGALTQLYTTGNINAEVASNNPGTQSGVFSFVPVSGTLSLSAGNTYLVTAPAYWVATYDSSGITTAGGGVFSSTEYLTQASGGWNGWANSGYFSGSPNISSLTAASGSTVPAEANFQFNVEESSPVPEPSTYALFGAGVGLLVLHLRRRNVRA